MKDFYAEYKKKLRTPDEAVKLVKSGDLKVLDQQFDNVCSMTIQTDADRLPALRDRLLAIDGVTEK